ncbi:MAG: hypothetical protein AB8I08_35815 [Sandaracinaceae bacterium]
MQSPRDSARFVCGGYLVAAPAERASWMSEQLVPSSVVSASDCIVEFPFAAWAESASRGSPRSDRKFAIACQVAREQGSLSESGLFSQRDAALALRRRLLPPDSPHLAFSIELPTDLVDSFLEDALEGAWFDRIAQGEQPGEGRSIGFDVLGFDFTGFHSYLCNGLERDFDELLGARPNRYGLIDKLEVARRCAEHCNQEGTGAEPVLWLPWRVVLHHRA